MSQKYGPLSDDDYLMSVSNREEDDEGSIHEENANDTFDDEEQPPAPSMFPGATDSGKAQGLLTNDQISLLIDDIEDDAGAMTSRRNLFEDDAKKGTPDDDNESSAGATRESDYPYENKERVLVVHAKPVGDGDDPDKPSILSRAFWERRRWQAIALVGLVAGLVAAITTSILTHHHGGGSSPAAAPANPSLTTTPSPTNAPTASSPSVILAESPDATVVAEEENGSQETLPTTAETAATTTTSSTSAAADTTTSTEATAEASTEGSSSSFHSFVTTEELYSAVDLYIKDPTATAKRYGHPIGTWNVSQLTDFSRVFEAQTLGEEEPRNPDMISFNEDVSGWDTSRATTMYGMFQGAEMFNQPLSDWKVASVTDMRHMFAMADEFNQPLNTWDVSNAQLNYMFYEAISFNQDISAWRVSHAAKGILYGATSFSQNLCSWGETLQATTEFSVDAFDNTACPEMGEPDLSAAPAGPFCHACA